MVRLLVLAALACGCHDTSLEQLKAVKEEVCKCKTSACGEEALKRVPQGDVKAGPKMQEVANEMLACMAKLYLKDRPVTDPDAPGATSPGSAGSASAKTP